MNKSERNDNRKHKKFVSRFEQLALHPRLHRVKNFNGLHKIRSTNSNL